jgi:NADPH-dependent ferric siderophore reductase
LDAVKELRGYAGDENGFKFMRQVVRAFAVGDPAAIPVMEKMLEQMKARNGMVVQSPDLKAKLAKIDEAVAQNQITPEDAQERKNELLEVEKARAGQTRTQAELEQERKRADQQWREKMASNNEAALNEWETSVRTKDPDFGNVTDEGDENHGVSIADQVFTELQARLSAKPPASQAEMVATAQKAYDTVKRRMSQFTPKPRAMKPVTSENSSRTAKVKPKSFKEAAESATGILYGSES